MTERRSVHWQSIIALACIVPGAGLLLLGAMTLLVMSFATALGENRPPTETLIVAGAAAFEGALLLGLAWVLFQRTRKDVSIHEVPFVPHVPRGAAAALAVVAFAVGTLVTIAAPAWVAALVLPLCTVVAVAAPLAEVCGLAIRGTPLGERWVPAAVLGLGMTLVPLVIILLEIVVLLMAVVTAAVWIALHPDTLQTLVALGSALERQTDTQMIAELVGPYLLNPAVIGSVLAYIALFVPMLEELLKPLGVWLFVGSIQSPRQGFALGALSGAAYALVESLGVSAQGGMEWTLGVGVRLATGVLHVTNSALMGWAIVSAFQHRAYVRLGSTYVLVALVHGLWNASAVGVAVSVLGGAGNAPEWLPMVGGAAVTSLVVLLAGMLGILHVSRSRLQQQSSPSILAPGPRG